MTPCLQNWPARILLVALTTGSVALLARSLTTEAKAQSAPGASAECRVPQAARKEPDAMFAVDSPQRQANDWAGWMTQQMAQGRSNFIVVPIKEVEHDEDKPDPRNPSQALCAW